MMGLSQAGDTGRHQHSPDTTIGRRQDQMPLERARKKVPPPKPPRPILLSNDSWDEDEWEKIPNEQDNVPRPVYNGGLELTEPRSRSTHINEARPSSSDAGNKGSLAVHLRPRPESSDDGSKSSLHSSSSKSISPSLADKRARVVSLIDMFEGKSPSTSPTKASTLLSRRDLGRRVRTERSNSFGISTSRKGASAAVRLSGNHSLSNSPPEPPPKPWSVMPPLPPRPVSTECGESGVPIVPPRTPAPLLPPKPLGSKPPTVSPRMTHRRSLSDSDPNAMSPIHAPPIVPPK